MITLSQLLQESVNIKGFSRWCERNIELTEDDYNGAKATFEELDKKLQDVLKGLYKDLGIEIKEEENDKNKRNKNDGDIKTTGEEESTEGNDGDGDGEGDKDKLKEKLESAEVKQQVTLIKCTKAISDVLNSPDTNVLPAMAKEAGKIENVVETVLKVICNAGNLDIEWIIQSFYNNENVESSLVMIQFAHDLGEISNQKEVELIESFIGAEE